MTAVPFWQQPNNLETLVSQLLSISHWWNEQHCCKSHQDGERERERNDGGRRVKTETETERGDRAAIVELLTTALISWDRPTSAYMGLSECRSDLCSSPRDPPALHRQSPGSPPPAPGDLAVQGEAEGVAGEEGHSQGLSAGSQACKHNSGMKDESSLGNVYWKSTSQLEQFTFTYLNTFSCASQ